MTSSMDLSAGAQNEQSTYPSPHLFLQPFWEYATDWSQRNVLFWDVIRQRGNQFLEN